MKDHLFVIDLARCTGCMTCVIACADRAHRPVALAWLQVEQIERGQWPEVSLVYRAVHCFHCAQPSCMAACAPEAIQIGAGGIVEIDARLCTGCGNCLAACPFDAITLSPENTASKCDACVDEQAAGLDPTCVRACPMRALSLGTSRETAVHQGGQRVAAFASQSDATQAAVLYLRRPPSASEQIPGADRDPTNPS
jgi:anaerobic dimethyl sulfoxide reductase subunit B (iron-sulfur subunit)